MSKTDMYTKLTKNLYTKPDTYLVSREVEKMNTKTYKLKDGTEIKETDTGTFAVVFPNKRYIIITTWKGFAEIEIEGHIFKLGEGES